MTRLGPRPLPLHLASATGFYLSCLSASNAWSNGSSIWNPVLTGKAAALEKSRAQSGNPDLPAFTGAVDEELRRRLSQMLDGVEVYRGHPYRRDIPDPDILWTEGTTRVLDFRRFRDGKKRGAPIFLIPSLVNRAYILDLSAETSLCRWLASEGFDVFLVDWDAPGEQEMAFTLSDYIARLDRAARAVSQSLDEQALFYAGYCMGGLLALAAAERAGDACSGLALLATPWDFHAEQVEHARMLGRLAGIFEPLIASTGGLPVDVLQSLFAGVDPLLGFRKFAAFSKLTSQSQKADAFVALEDWLNDGIALAGPVARECLAGWYGDNTPGRGEWRVDGAAVRPELFNKPSLALIPSGDRIVPPASAMGLAERLPRVTISMPKAGHIGMVVGSRRLTAAWEPLRNFILSAV